MDEENEGAGTSEGRLNHRISRWEENIQKVIWGQPTGFPAEIAERALRKCKIKGGGGFETKS